MKKHNKTIFSGFGIIDHDDEPKELEPEKKLIWSRWFAWRPVKAFPPKTESWIEEKKEKIVWMKMIERKFEYCDIFTFCGGFWMYRKINKIKKDSTITGWG